MLFNNSSVYDPYRSAAPVPIALYYIIAVGPVEGALAITFMFCLVTIPMLEKRLLQRRDGYARYRKDVPALLPVRFF